MSSITSAIHKSTRMRAKPTTLNVGSTPNPASHSRVSVQGETNHVECWFNTLRQRLGRFTRKTLSFSKHDDMHEGVLRLFLLEYNLSCIS